MKKLPTARRVSATPEEKKALALWLYEREVEDCITADDDFSAPLEDEMAPQSELALVGKGHIRLLPPNCETTASHLCYVAVLEKRGSRWLVAPFSRYGVPAVPGEWQTLRETTHLRVLCLWNAFEISDSVLTRSWLVDQMDTVEQQAVRQLLTAIATETPLPAELKSRTGPPLYHPLDPRHDYLEEEKARFSRIADTSLTYPLRKPPECLPLAAEEHDEYMADQDSQGESDEDSDSQE